MAGFFRTPDKKNAGQGTRKTFHFPDRCARCGVTNPTQRWKIGRDEASFGLGVSTYRNYSIEVPVCAACNAALPELNARAGWGALGVGILLCLVARVIPVWTWDIAFKGWAGPCLIGVLGLFVAHKIFGARCNIFFAGIRKRGKTLFFADANYQRDFDRINGS